MCLQIKDYAGEASDLGLYFVVEEDVLGQKLEHELIPRGKETPVTNDNKLMYVYLCSHWHISRISGAASRALSRGLSKVVPIQFLRMFTVSEVNEVRGIFYDCFDTVSAVSVVHHVVNLSVLMAAHCKFCTQRIVCINTKLLYMGTLQLSVCFQRLPAATEPHRDVLVGPHHCASLLELQVPHPCPHLSDTLDPHITVNAITTADGNA